MTDFKTRSSVPQTQSIVSLQSKAICTTSIAGENLPKGAVLKQSSTTDMRLVQTTSADDNKILGVAAEKSYSGRPLCVVTGGEFQVLVTGAVTKGDFLSSSSTTGTAYSTGTVPVDKLEILLFHWLVMQQQLQDLFGPVIRKLKYIKFLLFNNKNLIRSQQFV